MMDERLRAEFRGTIENVRSVGLSNSPRLDNLNLVAMAQAALNYLRGNPEPARNYECKFTLGPLGIPCHYPEMVRPNAYGYDPIALGDTDCRMEWQYAHMRAIVGERDACSVERGVRERVLGYLRDDNLAWINPSAYTGRIEQGYYVGTWTTAKVLVTLCDIVARDGDKRARQRARKVFEALRRLTQWDGDKAWYMGIAPWKDGQWLLEGWCQQHGRNYPFIIEPLVHYWETCGDEEALVLAKAFAEGFLAGSQPDMGTQRVQADSGAYTGHVHCHLHAVWGLAHLGVVLGERRYTEWARKVYEFTLSRGTDHGWYPEYVPQMEYRTEICVVGDMISLGAWLAQADMPRYWDHIERTIRNTLSRSQFFLTDAFLELFQRLHSGEPRGVMAQALRELRRLEGGFVAQATFDDWVSYSGNPVLGSAGLANNGIQMMGCCPPEGMRGIWEAWRWGVVERVDEVMVNLALSREHPAARVTACRSEDGAYEVAALRSGRFLLRPPAWAERDQVVLTRNGVVQDVEWGGPDNAYVVSNHVQLGDVCRLAWVVPTFRQTFVPASVEGHCKPVSFQWTGNQVLGVTPRGQYLPMFDGPNA